MRSKASAATRGASIDGWRSCARLPRGASETSRSDGADKAGAGHQSLVSTVGCDPLRDEAELVLGKCGSQLGRISYVPDSGIGVEISLDSIFVGLLRVAILRSLLLLLHDGVYNLPTAPVKLQETSCSRCYGGYNRLAATMEAAGN